MNYLKTFESYEEPIFLAHVKKPVEIRINIEAIEHVLDRMGRHGFQSTTIGGFKSLTPNITKDEIKETIEKAIEELTIALMQDRFNMYDKNDNFNRFVIRNINNYLNIVCELEPGDNNFSLIIITVMKDVNFKIGKDQFVILVDKEISSGYWNPKNNTIEQ